MTEDERTCEGCNVLALGPYGCWCTCPVDDDDSDDNGEVSE